MGRWNAEIAEHGYVYRPGQQNALAFPPAYPLLGRAFMWVTGQGPEWSLVVATHAAFAAALVLLVRYWDVRGAPRNAAGLALAALALFPGGVFFRAAHAESLFLLLMLAAMYAMQRHAPAVVTALIVGLATATREVGVALVAPWAMYAWDQGGSIGRRVSRVALLAPLALWGLAAFMAYQWLVLGDPLTFVEAHEHWRRRPAVSWPEELARSALLEPIWSTYVPGSESYWRHRDPQTAWFLSVVFWNPLAFVGASVLIALGAWKRWLTGRETTLAALLLLVPYATRGYDMEMGSTARFVSVAFPVFLVAGHLLARLPRPLAWAIFGGMAALLAYWSGKLCVGQLPY